MYEYMINVSRGGKFLFRTDWDNDSYRANDTARTLKNSLPDCEVTMYQRTNSRVQVGIQAE